MRLLRLGGFEDTQDYQSIVSDVELETSSIVRKSTIKKAELLFSNKPRHLSSKLIEVVVQLSSKYLQECLLRGGRASLPGVFYEDFNNTTNAIFD